MALTKTSLIQDGAVTQEKISGNVNLGGPKIANVSIANSSYTILDDTAVDTAGGYLVITGTGFESGAQVIINQTPALSTTYVNSTTLRAQVDSANAATYNVYVVNPDGGTATRINGLTYSGTPTWVTASTLANVVNATAFTGTFEATGATSYANTTALPAGFNLVSANGYYYGNIEVVSDTTYNFTIRAADDELQESDRSFALTALSINPPVSIEYLVIAGGGGGGNGVTGVYDGLGGGAGGYRSSVSGESSGGGASAESTFAISASTQYNVVVGSGGAAITNGSNSSFSSIVSIGGGHGYGNNPASSGGSGGGGGPAGAGTPGQGYAGGSGGGGGAGEVGDTDGPQQGGDGVSSSINGTPTFRGGGGGGGANTGAPSNPGGEGGGGFGNPNGLGGNGTVNTGGGGGGARNGGVPSGGTGGSGIVIIRYPDTYSEASSTTGSPTLTTVGGYKIYTFTGSGSITW